MDIDLDKYNIFKKNNFENIVCDLLKFLKELQSLEAKLWGISITKIKNDEEIIIEDSNHLIYLILNEKQEILENILRQKDVKDFFSSLQILFKDFNSLKRKIHKRDYLKNLITKLSIKLVDKHNFKAMEDIFILEKQLYEVLDRQDEDFKNILIDSSSINISISQISKFEKLITILKDVRNILGGHLEHHELWEDERLEFSNTSNIIHSLIENVEFLKKTIIEEKN